MPSARIIDGKPHVHCSQCEQYTPGPHIAIIVPPPVQVIVGGPPPDTIQPWCLDCFVAQIVAKQLAILAADKAQEPTN